MEAILKFINDNLGLTLIAAASLIQVSPININPWGWIMKMIKNGLMSDLTEKFEKMDQRISDLESKMDDSMIGNMRWEILGFSNSCRNGVLHSKEEWNHVIEQIREYEELCKRLNIANGVIEQESEFLRCMYQDRLRKNDFL